MMAVNSPDLKYPDTLFNTVFFPVKERHKFRIINQIKKGKINIVYCQHFLKLKLSLYRALIGPEGLRRLRLPRLQVVGI
jgi:hypothetical protein